MLSQNKQFTTLLTFYIYLHEKRVRTEKRDKQGQQGYISTSIYIKF